MSLKDTQIGYLTPYNVDFAFDNVSVSSWANRGGPNGTPALRNGYPSVGWMDEVEHGSDGIEHHLVNPVTDVLFGPHHSLEPSESLGITAWMVPARESQSVECQEGRLGYRLSRDGVYYRNRTNISKSEMKKRSTTGGTNISEPGPRSVRNRVGEPRQAPYESWCQSKNPR